MLAKNHPPDGFSHTRILNNSATHPYRGKNLSSRLRFRKHYTGCVPNLPYQ